MIEHRISLHSLCDDITSTIDRRRILSNDPRCKWMFERFAGLFASKPHTLEALITNITKLEPTEEILFDLENIKDFLDDAETLPLREEVEDILYSVGLDSSTIQDVIQRAGLLTTVTNHPVTTSRLPLITRRKLLSCKGAWCPTTFAHVRQYPEIFFGDSSVSGATASISSEVRSRDFSQSQALRLKRFFGVRHAVPKIPLPSKSESTPLSPSNGDLVDSSRSPGSPNDSRPEPEAQGTSATPIRTNLPVSIESEAVRNTVLNIIKTDDMRIGIISVSLVLSKAKEAGVELSRERLYAMIPRLEGVWMLDQDWLGRFNQQQNGQRLLTEQLAAKILSVVDQIPLDILHAQLGRNNSTFKSMTTSAVAAYISNLPGFQLHGEFIRAAKNYRYTAASENDPLENNLWRSMSSVIFPLDVSAITARYIGKPTLKPGPRDRTLRSSPLFVKSDRGYSALTNRPELYALIRAESDFITPFFGQLEEAEDDLSRMEQDEEISDWLNDEELDSPAETQPQQELDSEDLSTSMTVSRHFGETRTETLSIREIISQVLNSDLQIPEIQRSYVWKTTQVRDLFDSLYNGYPVGTLLVWDTEERLKGRRVGGIRYFDSKRGSLTRFLLDGQQRTTSIVNAIEGRGPRLYFNVLDENGAFRTSRSHLAFSARSIPIAGLDRESVESLLVKINIGKDDLAYDAVRTKLAHLVGILDREISVETLHGFDYGEATDVFIRVNSRGTKLKNAELAIANLAYRLPGTAGVDIQRFSNDLVARGWDFPVPYIIRLITAVATGRVSYTGLNSISDSEIVEAWMSVQTATTSWLEQLRKHLGITSEEVLAGKNSHIVPISWLAKHGVSECSQRLMYWFVLSSVFSRYSGTTDTNLDQDLRHVGETNEKTFVEQLLVPLRSRRSTLRVEPIDVERAGRQSALRTLMYISNLHIASGNLFGADRVSSLQQPPVSMPIFSSKFLKTVGFDPGSRWVKDGGIINTIFVDPEFDGDDVINMARSLRSEQRYQHGLPILSYYRNNEQIQQFLNQRSRLLLDQFNDVLTALETSQLGIRDVERSVQIIGRGRRELDPKNLPFDHTRRMMYDTIRKRILEIDPSVTEIETETYVGFTHHQTKRPFATIAKRRTVLNFNLDVEIDELSDPRGICRDVTNVGTHGIGNTGFTIKRMDEVALALKLIDQVMEIHT